MKVGRLTVVPLMFNFVYVHFATCDCITILMYCNTLATTKSTDLVCYYANKSVC